MIFDSPATGVQLSRLMLNKFLCDAFFSMSHKKGRTVSEVQKIVAFQRYKRRTKHWARLELLCLRRSY